MKPFKNQRKRRGLMWDLLHQLHVVLQRNWRHQLYMLLQRDRRHQLYVLLQRDWQHLRHQQHKKEKLKGKAVHQKHHLLLLLIPMIMDHLSQMQLKKHCCKLRFQILLCTTREYKVATMGNAVTNGIPCL